ncbi:MAG: aldolase [Dehalococcoidia bacterium]|nr:aldolase [Dehalococcoidia bacterium]
MAAFTGRVNSVIERLERGEVVFGPFVPAGSIRTATDITASPYDFCVFEMEHNAFDLADLRLSLQFLLDRRVVAEVGAAGSVAPAVVPFVRVPPLGRERNLWIIKQVLDIGVYGIVFPTINTVEDAIHALQAARYPQALDAPDREPRGLRGMAAGNPARYWGLDSLDYVDRADVWPHDPQGEILPILQCESAESVENLPAILRAVPKPGVILISETDLSASMGFRGAHTTEVEAAVKQAIATCREFGVPYGSPQTSADNIEQRIADGFSLLMPGFGPDLSLLQAGMAAAGRTA